MSYEPLPRRWLAPALLVVLTCGALAVWYATRPAPPPATSADGPPESDPPTPDPRVEFDTPYRNVKPGVGYVGDEACARCHQSIVDSYHAHPMGRSAALVSKAEPVEKYDPPGRTRFPSGPFDLEVEQTAGGVRHRLSLRERAPVAVPPYETRAEIAIGSGTRGRSYLCVERGAVWQSPASWFGPDQKWDVSPGFRLGNTARRPIGPACLYCHVDHVEPVPGAENRYREPLLTRQAAIGCERCHGPGELHVAERTARRLAEARDTSIVNPGRLSHPLQLAVCEQCHLQGEERVNRRGRDLFEYRPGLPFEQFVSVHVRHPALGGGTKSVGQFEQLEQSRCLTASGGAMVCTSCHDPHRTPAPAHRDAHYRQRCLTCHETKGCSEPPAARRAKDDSCVACHMPRSSSANIIHTSVTDHRIPRRPGAAPRAGGLPPNSSPLVRFRNGPFSPPPDERDRDLGIALARFSRRSSARELAGGADPAVLSAGRLELSLGRWPGDADAWQALALVRDGRGTAAERLKAATNAAALAPRSESALATLAKAATAAGELDLAVETAGKRLALHPDSLDPLVERAFVHLARGDWAKAESDCLAALRVQPLHPEARLYLAVCVHKSGDPAGGLREAETAARLESDPRERALLMTWYRRATR